MTGSIEDLDGESTDTSNAESPLTKGNETEHIMSRLCNPCGEGGSKQGKKQGTEGIKGVTIPRWMPMVFRPPKCMLIDEMDAKIAAYIFAADYVASLPGSSLKTLMPTRHLHHDVLNMLVCKLTEEEQILDTTSIAWFLPTMFAAVMEQYQGPFMGKVEFVTKIFVPIQDESIHWYLLVIDIDEQKLILLDSHPCHLRREWRRIQAIFLQEMLTDRSFYDFSDTKKPDIAGYRIIEPNGIDQELLESNDSGVWVATCMMDYDWDDEYDKISERTIRKERE
ncbi:Ulp1 protease family, C-terminal catalytic domain [Sesbania bispinosa]|nr:Ulp1 protease family, C-terminal catalytic domain [Sesbania bispinosa]